MEAELNSIVRISWLILNADVIEQKKLARKNSVLQSSDNSCSGSNTFETLPIAGRMVSQKRHFDDGTSFILRYLIQSNMIHDDEKVKISIRNSSNRMRDTLRHK